MYPRLRINLQHIRENVQTVRTQCRRHQLGVTAVTKVFCGDPVIAQAYLDGGISALGDSRLANLRRMEGLAAEKWLIRPPMLSEVEALTRYGDVSLNSELQTITAIAVAARRQGKCHKIILMADLGDVREGYVDEEELLQAARLCCAAEGVALWGLGVNLTCFSFVQPDEEKMAELARLAKRVEEAVGSPLAVISGGNSAAINLMLRGGICPGINNLRLGESLLFGKERATYNFLPGTHNDAFILECEIVELKEKPSLPWGTIGLDSYGNRPAFTDRGIRKKAICALGKQDFDLETCAPVDDGIILLGASSDHLMLDVSDSSHAYHVGDVMGLRLGYFSTMRAFTSPYVEKIYEN